MPIVNHYSNCNLVLGHFVHMLRALEGGFLLSSFNINALLLTEKLWLSSGQNIYNLTEWQRANKLHLKYITATVVLLCECAFVC